MKSGLTPFMVYQRIHGGETLFFLNIRGVGLTQDDRREGPAEQCLDMEETQIAFNLISSEVVRKKLIDTYFYLIL
jgi:hypothetical protein